MSVEDLMRDRYKVVANYPHSPYTIGDLVEISETGTSFHCTTTKDYDSFREDLVDQENYFSILRIIDFPDLFKKLFWWEERKESDMPQYVKSLINQKYYKVTSFYTFSFKGICNVPEELGIDYPWDNALPATEQDYLNQNKA